MENLYERNGLIFFTEEEIQIREMAEKYFIQQLKQCLKKMNNAFDFFRVESPLLTPGNLINPNYTSSDVFEIRTLHTDIESSTFDDIISKRLFLRPETTMGSFLCAKHLLNPHNEQKVRMPIVVWQHGKSFRNEQDQPNKFMRLKEFYQLEFQIIYGKTTANDYYTPILEEVRKMISDMIGPCDIIKSDRLPDYSEITMDIMCLRSNMEVCSISKRKDFENGNVIEVAIGTDRILYNFQEKV